MRDHLDAACGADYLTAMTAVTTTDQQVRAGEAARNAGGYSELVRLEAERRAANGQGQVVRDPATGRLSFQQQAGARNGR